MFFPNRLLLDQYVLYMTDEFPMHMDRCASVSSPYNAMSDQICHILADTSRIVPWNMADVNVVIFLSKLLAALRDRAYSVPTCFDPCSGMHARRRREVALARARAARRGRRAARTSDRSARPRGREKARFQSIRANHCSHPGHAL